MRILVPVDGSENSLRSIQFLTTRTDLLGTSPEIHVFLSQVPIPKHIYMTETAEELKAYYDNEAQGVFDAVAALLKGTAVKPIYSYTVGQAPDDIVNKANEIDADLIIMGTRGEGPVRGLLFGSVSNAVVARANRPILILRNKLPEGTHGLRVGLAVDGSNYSEKAVDYVLGHRELFGTGTRFELINAGEAMHPVSFASMQSMAVTTESLDELKKFREDAYNKAVPPLVKRFKDAGLEATGVKLDGEPGPIIAEYANEQPLDLLVMGSHGYGNFRAAMLGSVAMRIASASSVPLLIIR
jgi:nucleotide-binding universal stress UspA family protein